MMDKILRTSDAPNQADGSSSANEPQQLIQLAYQQRIDAMSPMERVARSVAMFQWTRQQLARQVILQHGEMSEDRLKWFVALRLYDNEPAIKNMIEEKLADVPG